MLMTEKADGAVQVVDSLPLILKLNASGEPLGWITYEDCAFYYAKNKIVWSMGQYEVILRGGTNAKTGQQSRLTLDTIVAVNCNKNPHSYRKIEGPQLSNRALFERDRNICAYCAQIYTRNKLTRDHVIPKSKGGKDIWDNTVTACRSCNQIKDDRTPEQAHMPLAYVPYTPCFNEHLILMNRKILVDQMEFLLSRVSRSSRLLVA